MTFRSEAIAALVDFVVLACWLGFGMILVLGRRGAAKGAQKRDVNSNAGFSLQGVSYRAACRRSSPESCDERRAFAGTIAAVAGLVCGSRGAQERRCANS
jgi:hypothetical protein